MILKRLHELLQDSQYSSNSQNDSDIPAMQLASAALLIELMFADFAEDESEHRSIRQSLQQHFSLSEQEIDQLIEEAANNREQSVSVYPFTAVINDNCQADQKIQLIRMLWRVAYADGRLDKFEEHYIRKIADLLYVSHKDFIRAKLAEANSGN